MHGLKLKMPISPKFTWEETDEALVVRVLIHGFSRTKGDVFATDALLKVNSPPFLFQLDLYKEVDDTHSSATIDVEGVVFRLKKVSIIMSVLVIH